MNDLSNKKVGDKVYGADGSEWKVERQLNDPEFALMITNGSTLRSVVTKDGRYRPAHPSCFFSEPVRIVPAQGECDFSGYREGDTVYFEVGCETIEYKKSDGFATTSYTLDLNGKDGYGRQIAFHAPPQIIPSNPDAFRIPAHIAERKKSVDWEKVPIDTLVEVYVLLSDTWCKKYFAGMDGDQPTYWCYGATSVTTAGHRNVAHKIRLAEGGAG